MTSGRRVAAVVIALVILAGCGGGDDAGGSGGSATAKATAAGGSATTDSADPATSDSGEATSERSDPPEQADSGGGSGGSADLPNGFPDELLPDGKVTASGSTESSGLRTQTVVVAVDDAEKALDAVKNKVSKAGWSVVTTVNSSEGGTYQGFLQVTKGDDQAVVSAVEDGEGGRPTYSVVYTSTS